MTKLHAPTIDHIRSLIAAERSALPIEAADLSTRGAAVIAHDVLISIEGMLAGLIAPACAACEAKKGEAA